MAAEKITGYKDSRPYTSREQAERYALKIFRDKAYKGEAAELVENFVQAVSGDELLTDQPLEIQLTVLEWIASDLVPGDFVLEEITSSDLARLLRDATGIELTQNAMKDAMLSAGYEPEDPGACLWVYKISLSSPAVKRALESVISAYREDQENG